MFARIEKQLLLGLDGIITSARTVNTGYISAKPSVLEEVLSGSLKLLIGTLTGLHHVSVLFGTTEVDDFSRTVTGIAGIGHITESGSRVVPVFNFVDRIKNEYETYTKDYSIESQMRFLDSSFPPFSAGEKRAALLIKRLVQSYGDVISQLSNDGPLIFSAYMLSLALEYIRFGFLSEKANANDIVFVDELMCWLAYRETTLDLALPNIELTTYGNEVLQTANLFNRIGLVCYDEKSNHVRCDRNENPGTTLGYRFAVADELNVIEEALKQKYKNKIYRKILQIIPYPECKSELEIVINDQKQRMTELENIISNQKKQINKLEKIIKTYYKDDFSEECKEEELKEVVKEPKQLIIENAEVDKKVLQEESKESEKVIIENAEKCKQVLQEESKDSQKVIIENTEKLPEVSIIEKNKYYYQDKDAPELWSHILNDVSDFEIEKTLKIDYARTLACKVIRVFTTEVKDLNAIQSNNGRWNIVYFDAIIKFADEIAISREGCVDKILSDTQKECKKSIRYLKDVVTKAAYESKWTCTYEYRKALIFEINGIEPIHEYHKNIRKQLKALKRNLESFKDQALFINHNKLIALCVVYLRDELAKVDLLKSEKLVYIKNRVNHLCKVFIEPVDKSIRYALDVLDYTPLSDKIIQADIQKFKEYAETIYNDVVNPKGVNIEFTDYPDPEIDLEIRKIHSSDKVNHKAEVEPESDSENYIRKPLMMLPYRIPYQQPKQLSCFDGVMTMFAGSSSDSESEDISFASELGL